MFLKLRELRKNKGINVKEISKLLGLKTESAYFKKESGKIKFSLEEAKIIADTLGKSIEDIFF